MVLELGMNDPSFKVSKTCSEFRSEVNNRIENVICGHFSAFLHVAL